ncbi:MAG: hypothetical protein LIR40_04620 [Bacteroidota bacterium]|nr:hypothetical protein [Bacteroidota bacterium]
MTITYKHTKDCCCYQEFLDNPTDRSAIKKFKKNFGESIMTPAYKLHVRLKTAKSAHEYNCIYGAGDNKIELMKDTKDNDFLILKTRVTSSYRKFFNYVTDPTSLEFLKQKDWVGQFKEIKNIHVIAVNNHQYDKV